VSKRVKAALLFLAEESAAQTQPSG
jgi:hypothetical protein